MPVTSSCKCNITDCSWWWGRNWEETTNSSGYWYDLFVF